MSSDWPVASALMAGRYRLVSLLETGGMAEIWRAEDELLDRPVAVKLPISPQVVWREARMAARLSHPGIAAVHDYREAVRPDGTVVPFVVMELLTGESVAARVERELIGWAEAARIGAAVADALAAAHASGVVHRDIKPGNVMLTPNGVKILDFGISVAAGEPDDDDTGATFGTPAYVAPERLDGMPAEPATDVYGVGVLLFEMVTGDPPYPVETWEELAAARATGPSQLPESLPADFRDVIRRCLDADPTKRPTAARLRADLLAVALRSRPPAPGRQAAGPAASARNASQPAAGGPIGNLIRSAGVPADRPGPTSPEPAANGRAPADANASHPSAHSLRLRNKAPNARSADVPWAAAPAASSPMAGNATANGSAGSSEPFGSAPSGGESPGADSASSGPTGSGPAGGGSTGDPAGGDLAGEGSAGRTPTGSSQTGSAPTAGKPGGSESAGGGAAGVGSAGGESAGSGGRGAGVDRRRRAAFAYADADDPRDWRPDDGGGTAGVRPQSGSQRPRGMRNFAAGRASAATLDMGESPRRRTALGIGVAVVLAALVGAFAVLAWTHRDRDRDVAIPPPVTVRPTVTVSKPASVPSSAAPTSVQVSPKASLTFADAVSRMRAAVEGGVAAGQIRRDVAQDLLNLLGPLSNAQGADLTGQVQALRDKIRTRAGEGAMSQARAAVLQSRLEDLDRAAGT